MTTLSGLDFWRAHRAPWPLVPLRKVARLGTGHTPSRNNPDYWENCTIPWVTTEDLSARHGTGLEPLKDTRQKISLLGLANSAAELHPVDTVMLSRTASIGHVVRIGRPMATTQAFVTWTCGSNLDPRYLHLVLLAMKQEFERLAYGSTHKTIYMPDIEQLRVSLPPLDRQEQIADFLDAETARIDALIEKKRRMMALLDARRREAVSAAVLRGLRGHQRRSTGSAFLGDAPTAWEVTRLRHLFSVQTGPFGSQLHAADYVEDGWPVINPANLADGTIRAGKYVSITDERRADLELHVLQAEDIILGRRGEMGRAAIVTEAEEGWVCGTGCLRLRARGARLDAEYLMLLLQTPPLRAYFSLASVGSTMENLNAEIVLDAPVLLPPHEEQREIIEFAARAANSHEAVTARLEKQVDLLREHRQALITAAVTSQLDIAKAAA